MATVRWLPLESNPEVMNKLLKSIGVPESWSFVDVYGLNEDLLALVPQPLGALILLFPISDDEEKFRAEQDKAIEEKGQTLSSNIFFLKQYVGNACGTVALIHGIANNSEKISLNAGPLKDFIDNSKGKTPEEIGHALENFKGIADAHDALAHEGRTAAPNIDVKLEPHFITFAMVENNLYELDGRKNFPINHGPTSRKTFLKDAAAICQKFIDRNPNESRFAMMALSPSTDN